MLIDHPTQLPGFWRGEIFSTVAAGDISPYHLVDTNMKTHWLQTKRGAGINVAVLDTGIDADHPEFSELDIVGKSFVSRRNGTGFHDGNDHGTHVAGIIAGKSVGVAPSIAKLIIGKVLGDNGAGGNKGIAEGIQWAVEEGANLINLSLGSAYNDPGTQAAIEDAHSKNVVVVAATGNERANYVSYPAVHCVGIGAVNRELTLAYFSNRGKNVDLVGYGVDVYSCIPNRRYAEFSGTSMATPFVTGIGANLQSQELALTGAIISNNPAKLLELETLTTDLGPAGQDTSYGRGFPDLARLFYRHLESTPGESYPSISISAKATDGKQYRPVVLEPADS